MSYQDHPELDQQIIAAARRLILEEGQTHFTMDELAQASGISRATLYRRIGSREALLARLADHEDITAGELGNPDLSARILSATRSVLSQIGSVSFTIEQVAATAEVGVATVYRHFGSKEGLLQALSAQFHPRQAPTRPGRRSSWQLAVW